MQGSILGGKYRLVAELGRGGMGSVWRAEHLELGTPVAIKLIDPHLADSPETQERFRREARAAARLRSTNVVQVFDYGIDKGIPYIAMELLVGTSLAAHLKQARILAPNSTSFILGGVATAMARAHEMGVVHRDLKPDNIFLVDESGSTVIKVLDFGVAKTNPAPGLPSMAMTRTGAMMGTPYYMSPEQAAGRREVDHRSDIWSYGVIAFECLTGLRPFASETLGGLVLAICTEPIPVPSQVAAVPRGFDEWFARVTSRPPEQRYQTIVEADSALRAVCQTDSAQRPSINRVNLQPAPPISTSSGLSGLPGTVSPAAITIATRERALGLATWSRALWVLGGLGSVIAVAVTLWFANRSVAPPKGAPPGTNAAMAIPIASHWSPPQDPVQSATAVPNLNASNGPVEGRIAATSATGTLPVASAPAPANQLPQRNSQRGLVGHQQPGDQHVANAAMAAPHGAVVTPVASTPAQPATAQSSRNTLEKQLGF